MSYEIIKLWENTPDFHPEYNQPEPNLEVHPVENPRGCMVVIPGGGYECVCIGHEGYPLADHFNRLGYYVYILTYRCKPYHHPCQQNDVNRAIRWARYRAKDCGYDPEKIGVIGFSAGGHLAMTACTKFDYGTVGDEIDAISCRPNLGVLCYGVLTLGTPYTEWGTTRHLLGEEFDPALAKALSAEEMVRSDMPPCFIWHTAEDGLVPVQNSLDFAKAIHSVGVPYELHVFPFGGHGMSLAKGDPHVARWAELLEEFTCIVWKI